MLDRFKFRYVFAKDFGGKTGICYKMPIFNLDTITDENFNKTVKSYIDYDYKLISIEQSTGLKDKHGKLIYEGDIIVIPNQYPFYCYKNEKDKKQDLNETNGEIRGESILNYIGIVENIFNCWQYVYHCVNPARRGMNEGINKTLNDYGFDEDENSIYEVIGNIYENSELLNEVENDTK